jgi:hypothetical protein
MADTVASHNAPLAAFLSGAQVRDRIDCLYPIRDRLQHREFLQAGLVTGTGIQPGIMVAVPDASVVQLARTDPSSPPPTSGPGLLPGDKLVDPYWLIERLTLATAQVVNGCCRLMGWEAELASSPYEPTARQRIELFDRSPGEFLDWGVDPVLFR